MLDAVEADPEARGWKRRAGTRKSPETNERPVIFTGINRFRLRRTCSTPKKKNKKPGDHSGFDFSTTRFTEVRLTLTASRPLFARENARRCANLTR